MKRVFGAVSGALRGLIPKATPPAANVAHQERVRKAMDSLAPKGVALPSEGKAHAIEIGVASSTGEESQMTPAGIYLAANAFYIVSEGGTTFEARERN